MCSRVCCMESWRNFEILHVTNSFLHFKESFQSHHFHILKRERYCWKERILECHNGAWRLSTGLVCDIIFCVLTITYDIVQVSMENSSQGWIHYSGRLGSVQWWINIPFYGSHLSFFMIGIGLDESLSSELFKGLDYLNEAWFHWHNFISSFCGSLLKGGVTDHPPWFGLWNSCTAIHSFKKGFSFSLRQLNKALQEESIAADLPSLNMLREWTSWSISLSRIHVTDKYLLTTKYPKYIQKSIITVVGIDLSIEDFVQRAPDLATAIMLLWSLGFWGGVLNSITLRPPPCD